MIDLPLESISAKKAIALGLLDALHRGEVIIEGTYKVTKEYGVSFKHRPFTFTDKKGKLRYVTFDDFYEVLKLNL